MQARLGSVTKKHKCFRCGRVFARREHLDRHERSHTKEQPFACNVCSKAFTRKDLLIRHTRLHHGASGSNESDPISTLAHQTPSSISGAGISSLSDPNGERDHLALPMSSFVHAGGETTQPETTSPHDDNNVFQYLAMDDFDAFADSLNLPTHPFSPSYQPLPPLSDDIFSVMSSAEPASLGLSPAETADRPEMPVPQPWEDDALSRYGSRLPSLEREASPKRESVPPSSHGRSQRISPTYMDHIVAQLTLFANVVPDSCTLPSRHTLNRFVHGYFSGFHLHYPIFHLPTLRLEELPVELVLSIASIGSQYCLEHIGGFKLFRLAQCIGVERQRRRGIDENGNDAMAHRNPDQVAEALHTARTFLLLTAVSMWSESNPPFHEALSMRSTLERLVQTPILKDFRPVDANDSTKWILHESIKRLTIVVYCFLNLQTMVFDVSPIMVVQDIHAQLPCSEKQWEASNPEQWREYLPSREAHVTFQHAYSHLFKSIVGKDYPTALSPLASHGLIHAIIQRIWLLHQAAKLPGSNVKLASTDVAQIEIALKRWQVGWEEHEEASATPLGGHGPMSFTSTALLRLAYIRINMDPWAVLSSMSSWDPERIALTFVAIPAMKRSARATRAALHCAHALSIPIKLGLNYVVRTQVFFWSNQYALCSLESALFLGKWLEAVTSPDSIDTRSPEESRLLEFVLQMVAETEYAAEREHLLATNKRLGAIIMRLWAKLFSAEGAWEIISLIHRCLVAYANLIERSDGP